jgi:hypothetical protein
MDPDLFFELTLTSFRDFISQERFRVIRKERPGSFDIGMIILESPQLKMRLTLEKGLVTLAIGGLGAPNNGSQDAWYDLDALLGYLVEQRKPRILSGFEAFTSRFLKRRKRKSRERSMVYETADDMSSISRQLEELKAGLIGSYPEIRQLLPQMVFGNNVTDLQRFRDQRNEDLFNELVRAR